MRIHVLALALIGFMLFANVSMILLPNKAFASAPIEIAPDVGVSASDSQFQLIDYSNSYVKFGANFYADQILMYGDKMYFTNIALGSSNNPTNNFGLGIQSGNATINAIGTNTVTTGITCDVATFCYPFYYYNLGQTLSRISVTQGSTTTAIPVSSFTTDFSAFSVMAAPAIYWDPTTRYYEVKVYYTGTTSISFESNTGGTGINPVSFESTATVYSVASDPDFQRVYQDTVNNKALFFDAEPSNGTYFESSYDIASGISTNTATGITNGGNTVNSATYFSPVELNGYVWAVGRDSTTGKNVYALRSTSALAAVNATSQTSSYQPRDIAQSTTKLYSPLVNNSTYGSIYMASQTRAYGSYAENLAYTGTSGTPAYGKVYDVPIGSNTSPAYSGSSTRIIAEHVQAGSTMIGQSIDGLLLHLQKNGSPSGTATIGVWDSSGTLKHTFSTQNIAAISGSATDYFYYGVPYTIAQDDRIGIAYTGGNVSNSLSVTWDNSGTSVPNAQVEGFNGVGWVELSGGGLSDLRGIFAISHIKTVVYDGSPDTTYTFFESGTGTIKVVKYNGSATLLAGSMTHTVGQSWSVIQLTDKMIVQTANDTYVIPRATDTISLLYPNTFNTRYAQTFLLSPGGRTYSSNPVYIANSTYAINFTPSLGTGAQTGVIIDSVDDATGTMNVYAPAKYYYLTAQSLTVESSTLAGTAWTISQLGTLVQIAPTGYSEYVGVNLVQNSTIFSQNVVQMSCDTSNYHLLLPMVAVGDDSSCNEWLVYDTVSGTAARHIPYSRTADLVHADLYGLYTFQLNAAAPSQYFTRTLYNGKTVDSGSFDDSGQLQQRLLYQQCYSIEVEEVNTGNTVQTGNICAGDETTKTISLTGIVIPADWLKQTWSHSITRTFTNSTHNGLLFTVEKSSQPYNASIYATDHPDPSLATFSHWFNSTNITGAFVANITTYNISSNQTVFFTVFENGRQVVFDVSSGQGFNLGVLSHINDLGLLFGLPIAIIFPIVTAAVFPPSQRHIGIIATGAVIGIMQFFGFFNTLPFNSGMWAISFVIIALGVVMGRRGG